MAQRLNKGYQDIATIWKYITPFIQQGKLKAILIGASYTNHIADKFLFGHLNPKWLLIELAQLATMIDHQHPASALRNVAIIITHIKPGIENNHTTKEIISTELTNNNLSIRFIIPQQGKILNL